MRRPLLASKKMVKTPPPSAPSSRSSTPTGRRESGPKDVSLGYGDSTCLPNSDVAVWVRKRGDHRGREEAYFSFPGAFNDHAGDSEEGAVRRSVSVPDLGLFLSVPEPISLSDKTNGEINLLLDLRAPAILSPPWVVLGLALNRQGVPLHIV